jgi:hypothetical protein
VRESLIAVVADEEWEGGVGGVFIFARRRLPARARVRLAVRGPVWSCYAQRYGAPRRDCKAAGLWAGPPHNSRTA